MKHTPRQSLAPTTRSLLACLISLAALSGCGSTSPVRGWQRDIDPEVIRFVVYPGEQNSSNRAKIVGTGVPLADGRIITALHVLEDFPAIASYECDSVNTRSIDTARTGGSDIAERDAAIIEAGCSFERSARITADRPPIGTPVTVTGFPAALIRNKPGCDLPDPVVIEGQIVQTPADLPDWPSDGTVIAIDGLRGFDLYGLSGGACAIQDPDGSCWVFGVASRAATGYITVLDIETPISVERAWVLVSPIPTAWVDHPRADESE